MKITISNLHLEILDRERQELLNKLFSFSKNFVLGGGTALSLQIAHRKSFDFDFFSQKEIPRTLLEKLSKIVQMKSVTNNTGDELTFFDKNTIKSTFLFYPFKPYYEILEVENGLQLFSTKEIAVQKAYTIGRRGEYRDYFDLYTILKNNYSSLEEIISNAEIVYGKIFNSKIFLEQLVYFNDLLTFEIMTVTDQQPPSKDEVKQFLEGKVREYIKAN